MQLVTFRCPTCNYTARNLPEATIVRCPLCKIQATRVPDADAAPRFSRRQDAHLGAVEK